MLQQTENKYLPYSARRYQLNALGEVMDASGEPLETVHKGGVPTVELEWVLGKTTYEVGLLVLLVYYQVKLSSHLWCEIEPLYIDGDVTNNSPGNLTYRFKNGPLEVEGNPGFYYVPFATRYAISETGVLINLETGAVKAWTATKPDIKRNSKGGYNYSRVVSDTGRSLTLFRHRTLCMVFKSYGPNIHSLVVNHKDGEPSNDELDNLEWTTYSRNNSHALDTGLRTKVRPVLMKNLETVKSKSSTAQRPVLKPLDTVKAMWCESA